MLVVVEADKVIETHLLSLHTFQPYMVGFIIVEAAFTFSKFDTIKYFLPARLRRPDRDIGLFYSSLLLASFIVIPQ